MRDFAELIEFLTGTMTLMTVYQPAIILHLLARDGAASRAALARMLSGNCIPRFAARGLSQALVGASRDRF